jgi:GNAT superfamily N-acetyltransferase
MIRPITFQEILNVWSNHLWPNRTSLIESNSAMIFLGGYSLKNMKSKSTFFGYFYNNILVGVNSGHMCDDNGYRSRGLYVYADYRNQGIGSQLLYKTIEQAKCENASYVWSYPKKSSWSTYETVGFELASDWETSELDINAYCIKRF